jgi:N-acetylneuraminic acid mutarotase
MLHGRPPAFETLEDRWFLTVAPSELPPIATQSFSSVRINFQPRNVDAPRGYKVDYGAKYGTRGNGLRYGWSSDRTRAAVFHDSPAFDSLRGETNVLMGTASWSIAAPNGWYVVRVLMGDPTQKTGDYRLNAEGKPIVKGEPYPGFPWIEGNSVVHVTDGKLTLTSDSKSVNNRLDSVAISRTSAPATTPQGTRIRWARTGFNSPIHRAESATVRVGNKLYVMGGFTNQYFTVTGRVDILDLKTMKWSRGAPLPGAQTHFGAASDGKSIYITGGQYGPLLSNRGTTQSWRYDIAANKWSTFVPLPTIRFGGQMSYVNGKLHFTAGDDKTRVRAQNEHFVLDLSRIRKGWYQAAPLPMPTDHHSQIVVNNQLYALGGEVEHGTSYLTNDGLYRYDENANRWITLAHMPQGSSHTEAATLTDGKRIFVIGGQVEAQQLSSQVRSYDIAKNRWVLHTSLPTQRKAGIGWIMGNKLYYMTGDDQTYGEPRWTFVGTIG